MGYLDVKEVSMEYTQKARGTPFGEVGVFSIVVQGEDLRPPIFVYYELEGFFQNLREYWRSFSEAQLGGRDLSARGWNDSSSLDRRLRDCLDDAQDEGGRRDSALFNKEGRMYYPCGRVPRSVFNDTFVFLEDAGGGRYSRINVAHGANDISWGPDHPLRDKFKNIDPEGPHADGMTNQEKLDMWIYKQSPPVECEQVNFDKGWEPAWDPAFPKMITNDNGNEVLNCSGYLSDVPVCVFYWLSAPKVDFNCTGTHLIPHPLHWGVESWHLSPWMRIAGAPTFRKPWGRIDRVIRRNQRLRVYFHNNFRIGLGPGDEGGSAIPSGKKKIVLVGRSWAGDWLGNDADSLAITFFIVSGVCALQAVFIAYQRWKDSQDEVVRLEKEVKKQKKKQKKVEAKVRRRMQRHGRESLQKSLLS